MLLSKELKFKYILSYNQSLLNFTNERCSVCRLLFWYEDNVGQFDTKHRTNRRCASALHTLWCDVCEVCRPAPGLRRWASHVFIWYVMVCDEVCRPAPGLCRWVSLSLSRISHFVVVCVGSADLLMVYVGGSLTHYPFCCFDVCGVHRSAPGLHRRASHASS